MRPVDYWYRGFEFLPGHGCSSHVFIVCCVGSGLCDKPITTSEESHRVCDLETSTLRWPRSELCCCATERSLRKSDWDRYVLKKEEKS